MTDTVSAPLARAEQAAYDAATQGAALRGSAAIGRVWMRDRDRAALLHRLSSNQIEKLKPGEGNQTVLTTPIGRIIDLLTVHCLDDALLLLTSTGRGPAIYSHLRKNIFFNDKVKAEDVTATLGQLTLYGPRAAELLAGAGLPAAELTPFGIAATTWASTTLYVARTRPIGGAGFNLIGAPEALGELAAALHAAGAHPLDDATHEVLRVEHGHGAYGHELSQEYIPLETGLWDAVSFSKGCYVGQEIIARMESRGRLAKQLRGLKFTHAPELPGEPAAPLAKLSVAGKEAGDLTSLVASPRHGLIGLAYVRTAHAEPGTAVGVGGAEGTVVALPFER